MKIRREGLVEKTDMLLFDIRELLQKLVELKSQDTIEVESVLLDEENKLTLIPCKYCGGAHEKPQHISACAKKNKRG